MSYILDALKKSEQERKQGEVPGLDSFLDNPHPPKSTSRILLYMLIGILLATTLTIGLWLFFRQPAAPPTAELANTETTAATSSQPDQPQQIIENATSSSGIETEANQPDQPATVAETETPPPALAKPTQEEDTNLNIIEPLPPPVTEASVNAPLQAENQDEPAQSQPEPVSFNNLPPDIKNALPKLVISAHYYSNKSSTRMAGINGRVMRQGQTITNGLILEEITRKGVIMSFHDYRFSLEVFNR